jgi:hypothetical protein
VKRTWILAPALVVLVGLVIATAIVLRSPAYHARFVSESEISLVDNRIVAFGHHARALIDAKARDQIVPRALEERDPDWTFRALAIALVTRETVANEDELRVLVRSLDAGPHLRWPAILALEDVGDRRAIDALTARALALREQAAKVPPEERWHIDPIPMENEANYVLKLALPALGLSRYGPVEVTLDDVRRVRATFEARRAEFPPQVLPR